MDIPDDRRWARPVFILLLALAVLKGLRMPSRWAITQYLFTYEHGFIRRGLWGELLHRVFGTWTYYYLFLAAIGLVLLALLIAVVVRLSQRLDGAEGTAALLAIGASPAISFVTHLAGYLEQLVYLAVLGVFALRRRPALQTIAAAAVAVLTPLVHEAAIFWIGPLLGLALLRGRDDDRQPATTRELLVVTAAILVVFAASTSVASVFGGASPVLADTIRVEGTGHLDIRPRQDAFGVLSTAPDPAADMRSRWASMDTLLDLFWSVLIFAPGTLFLTWLAVGRVRGGVNDGLASHLAAALVVAAALSPLLLHAVGWDLHRWNALSAFNAVLAALLVFGTSTVARGSMLFRPTLLAVTLSVAIWGTAADLILFDAYGANHPPFTSQIMFLYESATTGGWSIWIPDQ
ncbi:MAG TPA: hypothetical protein VFV98_04025 [Vicinamibacterales bacterium]|nr:hypothetical protein [Vicinamibacterales bacterium]